MPKKYVWILLLIGLPFWSWAQYSMNEMGLSAGLGWAMLPNSADLAMGPSVSGEYFFSHYACGKAYGFHFTGGINAAFPMNGKNGNWIDQPFATKSSLQIIALDGGAYGKIRLHEYHRPHEWAVLFGPKIMVPMVTKYTTDLENGTLGRTVSVNRFLPGLHLSLQFRKPIKKQSWFIEPGAEFFLAPLFQSTLGGNASFSQVFLKFSYAFWDQRG